MYTETRSPLNLPDTHGSPPAQHSSSLVGKHFNFCKSQVKRFEEFNFVQNNEVTTAQRGKIEIILP